MSDMTTLVWERVCVVCGASGTVRRAGRLFCGGCLRQVVRVSDRNAEPLELLAQRVARDIVREEITA